MQVKKVAILVAVGCAVSMLTGCVPDEEHQAVVTEKDAALAQVADLQQQLEDETSKLNSEKAKLRTATMQIDNLQAEVKTLEKRDAETAKALVDANMAIGEIEKALISAEESLIAETNSKRTVEQKHSDLMAEYEKLLDKYNQYKKNMSSLVSAAPASQPVAAAPAAVEAPKKAANPQDLMDLLDQMSGQ